MTEKIIHLNENPSFDEKPFNDIDERFLSVPDEFHAPDWVIEGIIPEGVGVVSGSGGVGKTTCIVPLALIAAGIKAEGSNLDNELTRRVIYITEDPKQVMTILNGMRQFLKWDDDQWDHVKNMFRVVDSRRMDIDEISHVLQSSTVWGHGDPILMMPLIVFDTASSNFAVMNESDNSEASAYMAIMKEHAFKYKTSIWIIAHLSKTSKGQSVDDIQNLGSRGASAWEDNAQWTATLASSLPNGEGHRIFRMGKRRENLHFDEISFEGSTHHETVKNRLGEDVSIQYRYTVPRKSSKDGRLLVKMKQRNADIETAIFEAIEVLEYPSKRDILELVKFKRNDVSDALSSMILSVTVKEFPLPQNVKKQGRSTYLGIVDETSK